MLSHTTMQLDRAWNTWSDRPAEMVFLPLGIRITPVLYSSRSRTASLIEPRVNAVRLGRHTVDASLVELETTLADTTVAFSAQKPGPFTICGSWNGTKSAEWGLRFWVSIAISAEGGETPEHDPATGTTLVKVGTRYVAVATDQAPVQVTGHDTLGALKADFEENGYFYVASRAARAPVLALRFNLEMNRQGRYAAAVADSAALAIAQAKAALAQRAVGKPLAPLHDGDHAGALDAIRDVVAWNTVWDDVNARPYTAVTRIWNLGKFAVWYNDQTYAALLSAFFDADLARENMAVALAGATPQGNIACIVTSRDSWVDRSQAPHGAMIAWQIYLRTGERSVLETSYSALARNQRWWRENRDPDGTGLVSCGTSDVGEGLYKGTAFGARNETGMDNSATHDEAIYEPETRTLSTFDLGLNCALALDAEMLAKIAAALGKTDEADEFEAAAAQSRRLISSELWDEERQIFANRQRKGGYVRSLSPTSFYPLLCGAASTAQAEALLRHLKDERTFATPYPLPNATRDDPAFADNVYWRGRIWPNVNYNVWLGLNRYGFREEAAKLAAESHALFMKSWKQDRIAAENYNAVTGEAMDQGDTDPFYIWAALLPMMAVGEVVDVSPFDGWCLRNHGGDVSIGPFLSPHGPAHVTVSEGMLTLTLKSRAALTMAGIGGLSRLHLSSGLFSCQVETARDGMVIGLPDVPQERVVDIRLNGEPLKPEAGPDGSLRITLPALGEKAVLTVLYHPLHDHGGMTAFPC